MRYTEDTIKKMLPRAYLRRHVAHEIYVTLNFFKNLVPVMDNFVYNDGTRKNLMSLKGTIPIVISDKTYHIPVCLWIEDNYPQTAPICYVRPTKEMMIVKGKYVSTNGQVLLPYLEEWQNESELVSLLQVMAAMFGESPPVVMRPRPENEQASCWLQFHRQGSVLSKADGTLYLSLTKEDGQPVQQQNETNC